MYIKVVDNIETRLPCLINLIKLYDRIETKLPLYI